MVYCFGTGVQLPTAPLTEGDEDEEGVHKHTVQGARIDEFARRLWGPIKRIRRRFRFYEVGWTEGKKCE
jgi:hypothetical protein